VYVKDRGLESHRHQQQDRGLKSHRHHST